jgi:hypothetical protein
MNLHGAGPMRGDTGPDGVVDGLAGREVRGHHPPLDAFLDQVAVPSTMSRRQCLAGRPRRPCFHAGA